MFSRNRGAEQQKYFEQLNEMEYRVNRVIEGRKKFNLLTRNSAQDSIQLRQNIAACQGVRLSANERPPDIRKLETQVAQFEAKCDSTFDEFARQSFPSLPKTTEIRIGLKKHVISISFMDSLGPFGIGPVLVGDTESLGRVALKRPKDDDPRMLEKTVERFRRESEVWKALKHDYILPFYGLCMYDKWPVLVSPLVEQRTLASVIGSTCRPEDKVRWLKQLAQALAYLHSKRVVHGDFKAANALLSPEGDALLCDFGLSKWFDTQTSAGLKGHGSANWLAPEVWCNQSRTSSADVWAYGMTIAEVLAGYRPFPEWDRQEICLGVVNNGSRPPHSPLGVGRVDFQPLWQMADFCWAYDPLMRVTMASVVAMFD